MARPLLTKRTDGAPYLRPPEIEASIDAALALDDPTAIARAALSDARHPEFLPLEAVVHLLRKAHREGRIGARDRLCAALLGRAELVLRRTLPGSSANAVEAREEALGTLAETIATDLNQEGPLDFYEIRFLQAFAMIRAKERVKAWRERARSELREPDTLDEVAAETHAFQAMPAQETKLELRDLGAAIDRLPETERDAVISVHLMGVSIDEAAAHAGVDPRTIRYRLKRAEARLRANQEDPREEDAS